MQWWEAIGVREFLAQHSGLRITSLKDEQISIEGVVSIFAEFPGGRVIDDEFHIRIDIPQAFPNCIPNVFETNKRFTRSPDYHTYKDGSLCLGSEIRLLRHCKPTPDIRVFFDEVVLPCLYSIEHKMVYGTTPFGELAHGEVGLIDDYEQMFGVEGKEAVMMTLAALGKRYREANKLACPCGCQKKLRQCDFRFSLKPIRVLAKRCWFRNYLNIHFTPVLKDTPQTRRNSQH